MKLLAFLFVLAFVANSEALANLASPTPSPVLPSQFVVASTFSLKNPGKLVQFTLNSPNTYIKSVPFGDAETTNAMVANSGAREIYINIVGASSSWFSVFDATTLKFKNQSAVTEDIVALDAEFDEGLGQLFIFGGTAKSYVELNPSSSA